MDSLTKLIAKEIASSDVSINAKRGDLFKVDFTVSGSALVKKGEDYSQVISFAIPYDKIVAVLLSKLNGVTLESVVKEALAEEIDSEQIKAQASAALKRIKGTGTRKCSGKITVEGEILDLAKIQVNKI